ncbi:Abi-alpha family protein [Pelomonas sp. BJYL3]|uniref:Abi-alpha family protein n=1 Tax=Pelomonas sp. BJYL3 TaxID=2976697 RepID=UPI0022B37E90|nr:Abi-alpha family protein [Pelomonas sp. BJYL3]
MDDEAIKEGAKAIQDVAQTAGKAMDIVQSSGRFIARHINGPLEQVLGMLEDKLRFTRAARRARLYERYRTELLAMGQDVTIKPMPLPFAIDALEQGALEEDDALQDLWARLLANASDARTATEARRSYVSILKNLTSLDAVIFDRLYTVTPRPGRHDQILTAGLPASATVQKEDSPNGTPADPSEEVKEALANLVRLGLLKFAHSWGGGEIYGVVNQTLTGDSLMRAIQRRHV